MEICPKCGLPKEACVCGQLAKGEEKIKVEVTKRKFGKMVTIITGIDKDSIKEVAKKLKSEFACGGTVKENTIELQGNHKDKIKEKLKKLGYEEENIEVL